MFSIKSLAVFSAISLSAFVSAGPVVARNNQITEAACPAGKFAPFKYVGCYNDPSTPNALQYNSYLDSTAMTVEMCTGFCKGNGFKYAGLEYYGECYCGGAINGASGVNPAAIAESSCSYPCTGNSSETCGGTDIISIYEDPTFADVDATVVSDFVYQGCYTDLVGNFGRTLGYTITPALTSMTTESCLAACKAEGYSYAGTEYGGECYCGMNLGNGTSLVDKLLTSASACNVPCAGGAGKVDAYCGGGALLSIFLATDLNSQYPCGTSPPVTSKTSPGGWSGWCQENDPAWGKSWGKTGSSHHWGSPSKPTSSQWKGSSAPAKDDHGSSWSSSDKGSSSSWWSWIW